MAEVVRLSDDDAKRILTKLGVKVTQVVAGSVYVNHDGWVHWQSQAFPAFDDEAPGHSGDLSCPICYGPRVSVGTERLPAIVCYGPDTEGLMIYGA